MQVKSGINSVVPIWIHWSADANLPPARKHPHQHQPSRGKVKVLPGNPSLPLRVMLQEMVRPKNGGLNGTALGIDLAIRGGEVRKLFYAGNFLGVLSKENIDPEEFLQEVYKGLLTRNNGTCPWDAKKSSFGHYVHIVMRCVLANYLRRERLRDSREEVTDDGELTQYTSDDKVNPAELSHLFNKVFQSLPEEDRTVARNFVLHLYAGTSRKEALSMVGRDEAWGGRILTSVRTTLTA